jgi:hypothetical protein
MGYGRLCDLLKLLLLLVLGLRAGCGMLGLTLRGFLLSLSLLFLFACTRSTVSFEAVPAVIRPECHDTLLTRVDIEPDQAHIRIDSIKHQARRQHAGPFALGQRLLVGLY